jgi:TRAP-type C4-dicarboxylate transport system permease small subunit
MRERYRQAMEWLYIACIAISGAALVAITLAIPYGVFMRYVMKSAASWPEPAAILLMVLFTFVGGAAVYRAKVHIAVTALLDAVNERVRRVMAALVILCLAGTCVFMIVWGVLLVRTTWHQSIAEFPGLSAGLTYAPIPLAGVITLLFLLEHVCIGDPPQSSVMYSDAPREVE